MPTSRNTLLRLIRRLPLPPERAPTVIGIDDWAIRKGHTYASIVVDLERHQPITLLEDRTSETVEIWLREHPTITIISRDRSRTYAAGASAGAPAAIQVADRFHILLNLREAVAQELERHGVVLLRTLPDRGAPTAADSVELVHLSGDGVTPSTTTPQALQVAGASVQDVPLTTSTIYPTTPTGQRAEAARQARRAERFAQYTQMVELQQQGLSQRTIARTIGVSPRTVSRWSSLSQFPERSRRTGDTSCLDPYKPYLLERWQAGCQNIAHLWRDVQSQGFPGSYRLVSDYLAPLRRGEPLRQAPLESLVPEGAAPQPPCYTAQQLSFLMFRRTEELTALEQHDLAALEQENGVGARLNRLTQTFVQLVRERNPAQLVPWLQEAEESPFPELHSFAAGIRQDYAAVRAALELPWSQGQVEGQITKLKLLKRQMYGRAKLDLLQQRLLHAA
jgi:transposase